MPTGDDDQQRTLRRDAEANRQKILLAAERLYAERGLIVGHDEIARAAGVAVGTIYRRFPDKSSLITALYSEKVDHTVAAAQAALTIEDPWLAIVEFMTRIIETQARSRGLRELAAAGNPHGRQLARYARENVAPVVRKLVARGHAAGVLRPEIAEQDLALIPVMVGAIIHAARDVDSDLWRRTLVIVLDGIRSDGHTPLPGNAPTGDHIRRILSS